MGDEKWENRAKVNRQRKRKEKRAKGNGKWSILDVRVFVADIAWFVCRRWLLRSVGHEQVQKTTQRQWTDGQFPFTIALCLFLFSLTSSH